jgi:predicted anti-sigma-YlaC factor YlaD
MKTTDCETALMAKMAEADGEASGILLDEVDRHISTCETCRVELEQLLDVNRRMSFERRADTSVDLWPMIKRQIEPAREHKIAVWPFAVIAVMLVAYKLVEMVPARDPGLFLKVVPIVILIAFFVLVKENPFRINAELAMEE